VKLSKKTTTPV